MRLATKIAVGIAALAGGAVLVRWQAARRFTNEPRYEVVRTLSESIEVRRYAALVVAETSVEGTLDTASNEGFRRLAGYIFGGNRARESLAMTTPVGVESERLAMTTPVGIESSGTEHVVTFVMPAGRTLDSLPVPNDARVTLAAMAERNVAVLTYGGATTAQIVSERTEALREALERAGLIIAGPAVSSRYDPPSTLPMLRRNEIWIPVTE